jgi:hypothetical protein
MRSRIQVLFYGLVLLVAPALVEGQVTHGKKPQLPAPYATKSSANSPSKVSPR